MYHYALVLKKTVPIKLDKLAAIKLMNRYEKMLYFMLSKYDDMVCNSTFEIVEKNDNRINLHLHAMIKSTMPYTLIAPPREKGISTFFEECTSELAWYIYCAKQPFTHEKVIEYIDLQLYGLEKANSPLIVPVSCIERQQHAELMKRLKTIRLV